MWLLLQLDKETTIHTLARLLCYYKLLGVTDLGVLSRLGQLLAPGQGQHLDQLPESQTHTHGGSQNAANAAKLTEPLLPNGLPKLLTGEPTAAETTRDHPKTKHKEEKL